MSGVNPCPGNWRLTPRGKCRVNRIYRPVDDDAGRCRSADARGRWQGLREVDLCVGGTGETAAARRQLGLRDRQQEGQCDADRQAHRDTDERRDDVRHQPRREVVPTDPPQRPYYAQTDRRVNRLYILLISI